MIRPTCRPSTPVAALLFGLVVGTLTLGQTGCSLLPHSMQPAQLRKLNRGPALGRDTTNFSIPDPALPDDGYKELSLGEDPFQTTVQ